MNKKLILVYGLADHQKSILETVFLKKNIIDVTDCFADLLALPAAAVVVDPKKMTLKEQSTFNEVFEHDYDTCIVLIKEMQIMRFLYVKEAFPLSMKNTISAINERLLIPEEYDNAKFHMAKTIADIKSIIIPDVDSSYKGQISHMENSCVPFDYLTRLMKVIPDLKPREKYPYRLELNSILMALMIAHGLQNEQNIDFHEKACGYDRTWIFEMADSMRAHYQKTVNKNRPKTV